MYRVGVLFPRSFPYSLFRRNLLHELSSTEYNTPQSLLFFPVIPLIFSSPLVRCNLLFFHTRACRDVGSKSHLPVKEIDYREREWAAQLARSFPPGIPLILRDHSDFSRIAPG